MRLPVLLAAATLWAGSASAQPAPLPGTPTGLPTTQDSRLIPVASSQRDWNAVATTPGGRVFVGYTQAEGPGVQLAELVNGVPVPYPDLTLNTPYLEGATVNGFVHVNSVRIGPDGALWVVDGGSPGIGKPAIPGAGRLFRIDLRTNKVTRIYSMAPVLNRLSFVDDVRFNGPVAYLTDAGWPGLLVLDLQTGALRRVLDLHPSTTDFRPIYADGKMLTTPEGKPVLVHADQLELSPDGQRLTYMPVSGPAARIGTQWLNDRTLPPLQLADHVEPWLDTPGTGGTAMDAAGNIYMGDANTRSILRIAPDGTATTVISDPRLIWTDAMWLDSAGYLWMPAAQLNRTKSMNGGIDAVQYPVWIYKLQVGAKPPANDHP